MKNPTLELLEEALAVKTEIERLHEELSRVLGNREKVKTVRRAKTARRRFGYLSVLR